MACAEEDEDSEVAKDRARSEREKKGFFFGFCFPRSNCFQSETTEKSAFSSLPLSLPLMPSNRMSPTTISFLGNRELSSY